MGVGVVVVGVGVEAYVDDEVDVGVGFVVLLGEAGGGNWRFIVGCVTVGHGWCLLLCVTEWTDGMQTGKFVGSVKFV